MYRFLILVFIISTYSSYAELSLISDFGEIINNSLDSSNKLSCGVSPVNNKKETTVDDVVSFCQQEYRSLCPEGVEPLEKPEVNRILDFIDQIELESEKKVKVTSNTYSATGKIRDNKLGNLKVTIDSSTGYEDRVYSQTILKLLAEYKKIEYNYIAPLVSEMKKKLATSINRQELSEPKKLELKKTINDTELITFTGLNKRLEDSQKELIKLTSNTSDARVINTLLQRNYDKWIVEEFMTRAPKVTHYNDKNKKNKNNGHGHKISHDFHGKYLKKADDVAPAKKEDYLRLMSELSPNVKNQFKKYQKALSHRHFLTQPNTCGSIGLTPNAFRFRLPVESVSSGAKLKDYITVCPGFIVALGKKTKKEQLQSLGHILGHELGHGIDSGRNPEIFHHYSGCMGAKSKSMGVRNYMREISSDVWGADAYVEILAEIGSSTNDPSRVYVDRLTALRKGFRRLCSSRGEVGHSPEGLLHPGGEYRGVNFFLQNKGMRELLGCAEDSGKPINNCKIKEGGAREARDNWGGYDYEVKQKILKKKLEIKHDKLDEDALEKMKEFLRKHENGKLKSHKGDWKSLKSKHSKLDMFEDEPFQGKNIKKMHGKMFEKKSPHIGSGGDKLSFTLEMLKSKLRESAHLLSGEEIRSFTSELRKISIGIEVLESPDKTKGMPGMRLIEERVRKDLLRLSLRLNTKIIEKKAEKIEIDSTSN